MYKLRHIRKAIDDISFLAGCGDVEEEEEILAIVEASLTTTESLIAEMAELLIQYASGDIVKAGHRGDTCLQCGTHIEHTPHRPNCRHQRTTKVLSKLRNEAREGGEE